MSDDTYTCKHCTARFEGEAGKAELKAHNEGFHPAGAPVARLLDTPAAVAAVGKDHGPAVQGIASELADAKAELSDLQERVKALEEGTRSGTDLDALTEQLAPRLGQALAAPAVVPQATSAEPERIPYADLQARARALEIPATGKYEELQIAIADEERRLAEAALAARSGEGTQGGDSTPAGDPDA